MIECSGHALSRIAEDDTTPIDDVNVQVAIGLFSNFFTNYGGNSDMVFSNGAVLPHAVLLHLFGAVPEAHPHLQAIVLSLMETLSEPARDHRNHIRDQRRSDARIGYALRSNQHARTEARRLCYVAAMAAPSTAPWNDRQEAYDINGARNRRRREVVASANTVIRNAESVMYCSRRWALYAVIVMLGYSLTSNTTLVRTSVRIQEVW